MASAQDNALAAKMEGYLTCSICLEILKDPRTLACYHSFCKSCLTKLVKGQREKAEGKIIEEFKCPDCRTVFQLKQQQSVEEIPRNHFIWNMLEVLAIQRRPNEIPCNQCDRQPAASRCTTCEQYLCGKCLTVHGNWPAFKEHTVFTIDELTKPENQAKIREKTRCKKHKNEIPQYYCETCKQLACIHCILLDHNKAGGHSCVSTEEVAEKKRELLKSSSGFLNNQLKEGNDLMQNIDHVTQERKNNVDKAKDGICQQLLNILKKFTEKLKEKAKNKYNEKQKGDVKAYVNKIEGSVKLAKNLLDKGSDEEIISFQNQIEENVKEVKSERPPIMKSVHDGDIQFKANPVKNIGITGNLNKMGEVEAKKSETKPSANDLESINIKQTETNELLDSATQKRFNTVTRIKKKSSISPELKFGLKSIQYVKGFGVIDKKLMIHVLEGHEGEAGQLITRTLEKYPFDGEHYIQTFRKTDYIEIQSGVGGHSLYRQFSCLLNNPNADGTIGCFLQFQETQRDGNNNKNTKIYAVTCHHVVKPEEHNDFISFYTTASGELELKKFSNEIEFHMLDKQVPVDIALIPVSESSGAFNFEHDECEVYEAEDISELENKMVQKEGASTGLTEGKIIGVNMCVKIEEEWYDDTLVVESFDDSTVFSERGDSGSLVTLKRNADERRHEAVSMVFAGGKVNFNSERKVSYTFPFRNAIDLLLEKNYIDSEFIILSSMLYDTESDNEGI